MLAAAAAGVPLLQNGTDFLSQLAMNYFKAFGYVTTAHAISFANDLKLAHYIKVSSLDNVLHVLITRAHITLFRSHQDTPSQRKWLQH